MLLTRGHTYLKAHACIYTRTYKFDNEPVISRLPKNASGIFDLSLLKPSETKTVVNQIVSELWSSQVDNPTTPMFTIFEEAEVFLRNIRGEVNEEVYRLVHVGRNFKTRAILITSDLALIDPSVIRLCSIRFHGNLNVEENSKRKFKSYYGKDWSRIAFEALESGDFIQLSNKQLNIISVPLFTPTTTPKLHIDIEQKVTTSKPKHELKWTRYVT